MLSTISQSVYYRPARSLFLVSCACIAMVLYRIAKADSFRFTFLAWNLFLAWVPLLVALFLYERSRNHSLTLWQGVAGWVLWLLFFPNAPYIITDLLHLAKPVKIIPIWYDSLMVFSFALAGLQAGMLSLYLMHKVVSRLIYPRVASLATAGSLILAGFGIYLGRFNRWNSWDILTNPAGLLVDCLHQLTNPTALKLTLGFSIVLSIIYLTFLSFFRTDSHDAVTQRHP
jgi:uncharacterized membrane protein